MRTNANRDHTMTTNEKQRGSTAIHDTQRHSMKTYKTGENLCKSQRHNDKRKSMETNWNRIEAKENQ